MYDIAIIGGGASGLVAAIVAARKQKSVCIIERNPRIGKKILATGNGRCNYTNVQMTSLDYNHPSFVQEIFSQFGVLETISFFDELGIVCKVEELGKAYPYSEQASSIVDCLLYEIERLGIAVVTNTPITKITKKSHFMLYQDNLLVVESNVVLLATGGKAMPQSGSDGLGYEISKMLVHQITKIKPALVKCSADFAFLKHLDGLKLHTKVDFFSDDQIVQTEVEDILFTSYGLSGPSILNASRIIGNLLDQQKPIWAMIYLTPSIEKSTLYQRFQMRQEMTIDQALIGLIHKRLIVVLLHLADIELKSLVKQIPASKLSTLIQLLTVLPIRITGLRGFEEAQVTAGGVKLEEIDAITLESQRTKGLFFSGEILDIDGKCGGYNLQWAWSSGIVASKHMVRLLK